MYLKKFPLCLLFLSLLSYQTVCSSDHPQNSLEETEGLSDQDLTVEEILTSVRRYRNLHSSKVEVDEHPLYRRGEMENDRFMVKLEKWDKDLITAQGEKIDLHLVEQEFRARKMEQEFRIRKIDGFQSSKPKFSRSNVGLLSLGIGFVLLHTTSSICYEDLGFMCFGAYLILTSQRTPAYAKQMVVAAVGMTVGLSIFALICRKYINECEAV